MADVVRWIDTQETDEVEAILREHAGVEQHLHELARTPEAHELRRRYTRHRRGSSDRRSIEPSTTSSTAATRGPSWTLTNGPSTANAN